MVEPKTRGQNMARLPDIIGTREYSISLLNLTFHKTN